jgi:23S rRNA (pseudouridine1915-N3)-methyltransferase
MDTLIRDYIRKIEPFAGVEIVEVKEERASAKMSPDEIRKREGRRILEKLGDLHSVCIALERGEMEMGSADFARRLDQLIFQSGKGVSFIVGGQEGLSAEVLQNAQEKVSFSRMTFPHDLARLILVEQIYRALTILRGIPYHR